MSAAVVERGEGRATGRVAEPGGCTSVTVVAADPVSRAGVLAQLRQSPALFVPECDGAEAQVVVLVTDSVTELTAQAVRRLRAERRGSRVVVLTGVLDDAGLFAAVEAGASGVLRRAEASPARLEAAVTAAADGDGALPPDLLGRLLDQVQQLTERVLAPRGLSFAGLTDRESRVLRLVSEGLDTAEVARELCYSERTVKAVIRDVTVRLQLRNRTHAVAYAIRHGLI